MTTLIKPEQTSILVLLIRFLAIFGLLCGLVACFAVFANDLYYFSHHGLTPSAVLFVGAFFLSFLPGAWGLAWVLASLPLTAGIPSVFQALLGVSVLAMPNPGLDLVAGLFLGLCAQGIWKRITREIGSNGRLSILSALGAWPIGLVLFVITASTALAVARNLYLSAAGTSLKGLLFNLMHFRPLDWRADYLPVGNWVAYAIAGLLIVMIAYLLKRVPLHQRSAWIFRPLMIGLLVSALIGLIQAATGFGLPQGQLEFRKDAFGFAALGMQPDLHAFAAHMLLGVVGLWGYFWVCKSRLEKYAIILVFFLCSAGLIASKSRASLMIALLALVMLSLIYFYHHAKKYFWICLVVFTLILTGIFIGLQSIHNDSLSSMGWVGELLSQMRHRRLDNLSDLGGMMGSRFEIWSAVGNMFIAYPLVGVGEGEFYRLSSVISFARSEFLQLNRGENAHNYFLQVLAENGLVGIIVFTVAFIVPYRASHDKHIVLPAVIGLISLFLGNVFAHSFLVRENLLLGAALLGLMYALGSDIHQPLSSMPTFKIKRTRYLYPLGVLVLLAGIAYEVYFSFGRLPFKAGADCFTKELPLYQDGWTSGAWGERLPRGAKEVDLTLIPRRQHLDRQPLIVRVDLLSWEAGKGNVPISTGMYEWTSDEIATLKLTLPTSYYNSPNLITVNLTVSSCYTPRNLGINTDSRRLGLQIVNLVYR
jgi:O-antigen ligase